MFETYDAGAEFRRSSSTDSSISGLPLKDDAMPAPEQPNPSQSDLDKPEVRRFVDLMMGHYLAELDIQASNRLKMAEDEAYYDHDQWKPEDEAVLAERGQEALVYNVLATTVNWILGAERRGRVEAKILPRRKDGSQAAERKTQLMKYLEDSNRSTFSVSRSYAETVKAGLGWIESGFRSEDEGEPIYDRHESWRNILHDSTASEMDLEDARYQFRVKWSDVDSANAFFPDRKEIIELAAADSFQTAASVEGYGDDAMDSQEQTTNQSHDRFINPTSDRRRVRLIEAWFKIPKTEKRLRGGDFSGEIHDPQSLGHFDDIITGRAKVATVTTMRVYVLIFTSAGALWFSPSPYRHNKYPFTPIWGYQRAADKQPYGVIRGLKGMQDDINKRASKALAILSSNKVVMDAGAVDDLDAFEDEMARPNSVIVKKKGYQLDISADRDLASAHLDMFSRTVSMIQQTSGVTDEALGRTTNATSGKAIGLRQEQGQLSVSLIFDNLRLARQIHGEKMLSLIEQFMTKQKSFRITNSRGSPDFIDINDGLPENDISKTKADYIISEDAWNATVRQSQTEELLNLLQQLAPSAPQVVMVVLDLVIETMDIPSKNEIVKRIRQMTGMTDPDADPNNPDPEQLAFQEQKKMQAAKEERAAEAQLATIEAKAAAETARADKTKAEAERILKSLPQDNIKTQQDALTLAMEMLQKRAAIPMADELLAESGYNINALLPAPAPPPSPASATPQPLQIPPPGPAPEASAPLPMG